MLKISVHEDSKGLNLTLEGRLAGPWIGEAERVWLALGGRAAGQPVVIDLSGVTFVEAEGERLLARMFEQGAELQAADVMNKAIIEQIQSGHPQTRRP